MANIGLDGKTHIVIGRDNEYQMWQISKSNSIEEVIGATTHWHRFTIINGNSFQKNDVLRVIIENAHPASLIPVKYREEGCNTYFIARNCGQAVRILCGLKLKVPFSKENCDLYLELILNYVALEEEPLVMQKYILDANISRFNGTLKVLDLSNYHNDPALQDIFCPLSMSKSLKYVFCSIRSYYNRINTIILSDNELTSLEVFESLVPSKTIRAFDLRNNQIDWAGLEKMPPCLKLKELWLDGNPLCNTYDKPCQYVAHVKSIVPSLEILDGQNIVESEPWEPIPCRNFLVQHEMSIGFVDQFLEHYFKLYEGEDRHTLVNMYHTNSLFSISIHESNSVDYNRLKGYMCYNRNILTLSDYAKGYSQLKQGPQEIMAAINSLPQVQFDPQSFTVDVPIFKEGCMAMISVGGVLRELTHNALANSKLTFHRLFILRTCRSLPGQWRIFNDMLSIGIASTMQCVKSFSDDFTMYKEAEELLNEERSKLIDKVSKVTSLIPSWSTKFLEGASWDLELALQAFTDQYKTYQIPESAFNSVT